MFIIINRCEAYSQFNQLVGTYELKDTAFLSYSYKLVLNKDSTFYYSWYSHMQGGTQQGLWHIKSKKTIILNSYVKPSFRQKYEIRNCHVDKDSILARVRFFDTNGAPVSPFPLFLLGKDTLRWSQVDSSSFVLYYNQKKPRSNRLKCFAFPNVSFTSKIPSTLPFCIDYYSYIESAFYPHFFDNELVRYNISKRYIKFKKFKKQLKR